MHFLLRGVKCIGFLRGVTLGSCSRGGADLIDRGGDVKRKGIMIRGDVFCNFPKKKRNVGDHLLAIREDVILRTSTRKERREGWQRD